ncbi:SWIM zinc finger family protein [Actinomadura rayongensis]|uniref:SWIM zinc finger family protein n=1 Tax=Actinomadura rayongensis TaxID=1429076 RepID=A0A6I4W9B1_9ACTN|nr:SWIM zinc finger family protein [Actinomadura rayongensis]MXQ66208.1 SWIM zinc finger family protein [Actinomadura rayongensis]
MSITAPAHGYSYARPSGLSDGRLGLSTSGGRTAKGPAARPHFFSGVVTRPAPAAAALLAVADVATTRYHRPGGASRDPVVTCNGDRLRLEAFSGCGGVYARLDLLAGALDGDVHDLGTTNVDVNPPLRTALARVGAGDPLHFAVGADELVVTTGDGAAVEKKVPLPDRWLRGFAEVQVITAGFDPRAELRGPEAVRFVRSLRSGGAPWFVPAGRTLRPAARPVPGAVCAAAPERLRTMLPLLRFATALRAYGPPAPDGPAASVWELELPGMRYVLALSPEVHRGFSGEGAVLDALAGDDTADDADLVGALLAFEPRLDTDVLAERSGLPANRVRAALTCLGTAGRVGFDAAEAAYFHRELPYDGTRVTALNPRLRAARELAASVRFATDGTALVPGSEREHRVRETSCTCEWWTRHGGGRGPCKHVLAVRLAGEAR